MRVAQEAALRDVPEGPVRDYLEWLIGDKVPTSKAAPYRDGWIGRSYTVFFDDEGRDPFPTAYRIDVLRKLISPGVVTWRVEYTTPTGVRRRSWNATITWEEVAS